MLLTINRPDRLNTMTMPMFTDLAGRPGRCGTAVPGPGPDGAGERAFCAGFDLAEIDVITRMGCGSSCASRSSPPAAWRLRALPFR